MKELYYVIGDSRKPNCIKQTLLNKGGIDDLDLYFDSEDVIYYINEESKIRCAIDMELKKFILYYGTELKPIESEETFEPFDKVIVKFRGKGDLAVDTFSHKKGKWFYCGLVLYYECHHYEPWMKKYLGTNTPWNEFEKE